MTDKVQNDTIDHIGLSTNNILLEQLSRNDGIISFQVTAERNLWYDHRTLPTCNKICNANKPIPVFFFTGAYQETLVQRRPLAGCLFVSWMLSTVTVSVRSRLSRQHLKQGAKIIGLQNIINKLIVQARLSSKHEMFSSVNPVIGILYCGKFFKMWSG